MTTQPSNIQSSISNVHGGLKVYDKSDRLMKRNAKIRADYYKLLEKRDTHLNKLCKIQEQIRSMQKSLAYINKKMHNEKPL